MGKYTVRIKHEDGNEFRYRRSVDLEIQYITGVGEEKSILYSYKLARKFVNELRIFLDTEDGIINVKRIHDESVERLPDTLTIGLYDANTEEPLEESVFLFYVRLPLGPVYNFDEDPWHPGNLYAFYDKGETFGEFQQSIGEIQSTITQWMPSGSLEKDRYSNMSSGVIWVQGGYGSGKSTLLSKLIKSVNWSTQQGQFLRPLRPMGSTPIVVDLGKHFTAEDPVSWKSIRKAILDETVVFCGALLNDLVADGAVGSSLDLPIHTIAREARNVTDLITACDLVEIYSCLAKYYPGIVFILDGFDTVWDSDPHMPQDSIMNMMKMLLNPKNVLRNEQARLLRGREKFSKYEAALLAHALQEQSVWGFCAVVVVADHLPPSDTGRFSTTWDALKDGYCRGEKDYLHIQMSERLNRDKVVRILREIPTPLSDHILERIADNAISWTNGHIFCTIVLLTEFLKCIKDEKFSGTDVLQVHTLIDKLIGRHEVESSIFEYLLGQKKYETQSGETLKTMRTQVIERYILRGLSKSKSSGSVVGQILRETQFEEGEIILAFSRLCAKGILLRSARLNCDPDFLNTIESIKKQRFTLSNKWLKSVVNNHITEDTIHA